MEQQPASTRSDFWLKRRTSQPRTLKKNFYSISTLSAAVPRDGSGDRSSRPTPTLSSDSSGRAESCRASSGNSQGPGGRDARCPQLAERRRLSGRAWSPGWSPLCGRPSSVTFGPRARPRFSCRRRQMAAKAPSTTTQAQHRDTPGSREPACHARVQGAASLRKETSLQGPSAGWGGSFHSLPGTQACPHPAPCPAAAPPSTPASGPPCRPPFQVPPGAACGSS